MIASHSETTLRKTSFVGSEIACRYGETGVAADEPEKHVGIEEQSHLPSNAARISSGRGASKSFGTVNSPAHNPKGRGDRPCPSSSDVTGFISITGRSARITSNVSPASTRRR